MYPVTKIKGRICFAFAVGAMLLASGCAHHDDTPPPAPVGSLTRHLDLVGDDGRLIGTIAPPDRAPSRY